MFWAGFCGVLPPIIYAQFALQMGFVGVLVEIKVAMLPFADMTFVFSPVAFKGHLSYRYWIYSLILLQGAKTHIEVLRCLHENCWDGILLCFVWWDLLACLSFVDFYPFW